MKRFLKQVVSVVLIMIIIVGALGSALAEIKTVHEGKYKVGEDIRAGLYTIECVEASELYSSYKDMMDGLASLDDTTSAIFGFFGNLADKPTVKIRVLGSFGEEISKFELETGDKKDISLSDGETLEIDGDKCSCKLYSKANPVDISKISWGMSKNEIIDVMGCNPDKESTDPKLGLKMSYQDQPFGDINGGLTFFLKDDVMYSWNFSWDNVDEKRNAYLTTLMNSQYGEAQKNEAERLGFLLALSSVTPTDEQKAALLVMLRNEDDYGFSIKHWNDENTYAFLFCRSGGEIVETALYFFPSDFLKDTIEQAKEEISKAEDSASELQRELDEAASEIRFRGIPWGSNYPTVKKEFKGEFIMDTSSGLFWGGIDTLHELVPWFPKQRVGYLATEKCFTVSSPSITVGGYKVSTILLFFANQPDSNGKITEADSLTSLYGARYDISTYNMDFDKAAEDLKKKLTDVYGDIHATDVVKDDSSWTPVTTNYYIWKGGNDTYAVLAVAKSKKSSLSDGEIHIFYLWGEGDVMLKTANDIITAEKEANATPEPYNTDSTEGL